jgi:hypothetical protein
LCEGNPLMTKPYDLQIVGSHQAALRSRKRESGG